MGTLCICRGFPLFPLRRHAPENNDTRRKEEPEMKDEKTTAAPDVGSAVDVEAIMRKYDR